MDSIERIKEQPTPNDFILKNNEIIDVLNAILNTHGYVIAVLKNDSTNQQINTNLIPTPTIQ